MLKVSGNGSRGVREVVRSLERLADNAQALNGKHRVTADELFNPCFMQQHTRYQSFDEFKRDSPAEVSAAADWVPPPEFEQFVREKTIFGSWPEMLKQAVGDWANQRLFSGVRLGG